MSEFRKYFSTIIVFSIYYVKNIRSLIYQYFKDLKKKYNLYKKIRRSKLLNNTSKYLFLQKNPNKNLIM